MQLLYQTDPYLIEFTAEVLDRRAEGDMLDRMAFFQELAGSLQTPGHWCPRRVARP